MTVAESSLYATAEREPYAWERMVAKFRKNGGVLLTSDFRGDVHLFDEWRRIIVKDLPRHGFRVQSKKITPKLWEYRLMEPVALEWRGNQAVWA
jgi:hypothetical protein